MINPISGQQDSDRILGEWQRWLILAIGVSFVLILPLVIRNTYYVQVLILGLLFAYLALAWNIIGGMAGQLSFGHAIFFGIGAYTSTILFRDVGLTPWIGMLLGGLLSGLIAMALGYPTFRLRGAYFALATLAFGEIARAFVNNTNFLFGIEIRGSRGILVPLRGQAPLAYQFQDKRYFYYIVLLLLVILIYIVYQLKRSKLGLYLSAIGDNEDAAVSLGVNASAAKLKAFLISAFFTAVGGTFYAQLLHFVDAPSVFGGNISLMLVLFATTGGPAYLLGPVVGTLLLMPIAEVTRILLAGRFTGVHMVIYGLILVLVMRFMPRGVLFEAERFILWWKRRRSRQVVLEESQAIESQGVKHGTS
jgi:branched-chain amino acid transport system permease protein